MWTATFRILVKPKPASTNGVLLILIRCSLMTLKLGHEAWWLHDAVDVFEKVTSGLEGIAEQKCFCHLALCTSEQTTSTEWHYYCPKDVEPLFGNIKSIVTVNSKVNFILKWEISFESHLFAITPFLLWKHQSTIAMFCIWLWYLLFWMLEIVCYCLKVHKRFDQYLPFSNSTIEF